MKIAVFNHNKSKTATTSKLLARDGVDHFALFHTQAEADVYLKLGTVAEEHVLVTGAQLGLSYQRNAALDLVEAGEWICFLSDDLLHITELETYDAELTDRLIVDSKDKHAVSIANWMFGKKLSPQKFVARFPEQIAEAEKHGFYLAGFTAYANPFFRRKKFMYGGFCDGRATLNKKCHLRFDERFCLIDDYAWSCIHMCEIGGLLVNEWICPEMVRTKATPKYISRKYWECHQLVTSWPQWAHYADKANCPKGTHVRLKRKTK